MKPGGGQYLKPGHTRGKRCASSPLGRGLVTALSSLGHGPVTTRVPHPAEGTLLSIPHHQGLSPHSWGPDVNRKGAERG